MHFHLIHSIDRYLSPLWRSAQHLLSLYYPFLVLFAVDIEGSGVYVLQVFLNQHIMPSYLLVVLVGNVSLWNSMNSGKLL